MAHVAISVDVKLMLYDIMQIICTFAYVGLD